MEPQEPTNPQTPANPGSAPAGPPEGGLPPSYPSPNSTPPKKGKAKWGIVGIIIIAAVVIVLAYAFFANRADRKQDKSNNSTSQSQSSGDTFKAPSGEYSALTPKGWKIEASDEANKAAKSAGGEGVIYIPATAHGSDQLSAISIYSYPIPEGQTVDSMIAAGKEAYQQLPGFEEVENKKVTKNGKQGVYVEVKYELQNTTLHQSQLAIESNGKVYTVTATLPEADWAANQAMVKEIQDSLKVN